MAYLIFTANGEEYDRRELRGPMVIGRAPDCNVSIHDIVLSRHHCRIEAGTNEAGEDVWILTDLHSKNGTHLRGHQIDRRVLQDADELRIGRTRLTFLAGAFVPGRSVRKRAVVRASDPHEALAGTVSGMVVCEPGESGVFPGLPSPKPRPADPSAYMRDDVYGMISEIVSSSWDSVMAQNSQPIRMQRAMPAAAMTKASQGSIRPKARVSFSLQAQDRLDSAPPEAPSAERPRIRRRHWVCASATLVIVTLFTFAWSALSATGDSHESPALAAPPSSARPVDSESAVPAAGAIVDVDFSISYLVGY